MVAAISVITLPARLGIRAGRFALSLLRGGPEDPVAPPLRPDPVAPAPPHVSEEPVPVAVSSDPETLGGPGPELEIAEPWSGYDSMLVPEVVQQLAAAPVEAAAAVRIYESANRARSGIIDAAERRLRTAT
jgi:hypothetical protein